jgi:hypothetical protein
MRRTSVQRNQTRRRVVHKKPSPEFKGGRFLAARVHAAALGRPRQAAVWSEWGTNRENARGTDSFPSEDPDLLGLQIGED